jgi:8-oxo-dGTP pyrophosphatase MutT (NUDIX family)
MTEPGGGAYSPWMEDLRARLGRSFPSRPRASEREEGAAPLRPAAVLIPLYVREKALWTLFTKRTDLVEHHKGQISFPGGGKHAADANLWETAIRETEEEIGVPPPASASSARCRSSRPSPTSRSRRSSARFPIRSHSRRTRARWNPSSRSPCRTSSIRWSSRSAP